MKKNKSISNILKNLSKNQIYVNEMEYIEFKTTSKRNNPIRKFWKELLNAMPRKLYLEVKSKKTDLIRKNIIDYKINTFQFENENPSKELEECLSKIYVYMIKE